MFTTANDNFVISLLHPDSYDDITFLPNSSAWSVCRALSKIEVDTATTAEIFLAFLTVATHPGACMAANSSLRSAATYSIQTVLA